jgi:hypothetical protein
MNDGVGIRRRSNRQLSSFVQQLRVLRGPRGIEERKVFVGGAHVGGSGELSKVMALDAYVETTVLGGSIIDTAERIFHVV